MAEKIKILIAEDSQDDAELMVAELCRAGFAPVWKRVETEPDFLAELKKSPDIILSDYSMPQFNGMRAVELLQESGLDIPFILISGTVGEDAAVEAMKKGVTDYLLKDRIMRLGSAVERALGEAKAHTERKRVEDELRKSEANLAEAQWIARMGSWQFDIATNTVRWSNELYRIFNIEKTAFGNNYESFLNCVLPEDRLRVAQTSAGARANGKSFEMEYHIQTQAGETRTIYEIGHAVKDAAGKIVGLFGVAQDITERKRVEEKLREAKEQIQYILDNTRDVIFQIDLEGNYIYGNPAAEKLTGYPLRQLLQMNMMQLVVPEHHALLRERLQRRLANEVEEKTFEFEIQHRDGHRIWTELTTSGVFNQERRLVAIQGVVRDVTERRKLEEQFRQSQKMEAIGQLAGGVAHDFNNVLAVIQMQADLLKVEENLSPAHKEYADVIIAAAQRATALTRQLLLFSRKQIMQSCDLDWNQSINHMTNMLRRTIGEDIQLQFKFAMRPLFIRADAGMMDQVLLNLAVNARDAMPRGGRLTIETSTIEFDDAAAAQFSQGRPGSFVCLSVSDTGCGISRENLPRIFEPFFTTKEIGKGTGLGLATVFGIVQQHQGWVNVYSEVGKGTTFRIYLPRLQKASEQKTEHPASETLRGGKETILLVEDDSYLRASIRMALTQLGYRVIEAISGIEALEIWKQHHGEIRLLLTDMVMPGGLTGKDLGDQLLKENPNLRVIYTSGYSAEVATKGFPLEEGVNFLNKPFQAHKLAQTIRVALDA
jgi:two-component system, cell cycle sensor histidine kinase and response regulator CckA